MGTQYKLQPLEIDAIIRALRDHMILVRSKRIAGLKALYELLSEKLGYEVWQIRKVHKMMQPTTALAQDLLRARAFRMASRLVKEAGPALIKELLQNPTIGVLEPDRKGQEGMGGGLFITVQAESCGAVNVGISQPQLKEASVSEPLSQEDDGGVLTADERKELEALECNDYTVQPALLAPEPQTADIQLVKRTHGGIGNSKAYRDAVARAKAKLDKKRNKQIT